MNTFEKVVIEPFRGLFEKILQFLPNFLASVLIFALGIVVAGIGKAVFQRIFKILKIDTHMERLGLSSALSKGGIKESASVLLSRAMGWIVLFVFLVISLRSLEVPAVERLLESFFIYLPNVFIAALIIVFGYILGNFFGQAVLIGLVNAGVGFAGVIARTARMAIFLLASTMALEQLGIGSGTIIIAFAISFGGLVLALSLAFGLGGKELAKEYLEKKMRGEEQKDEINHL